VLVCVLSVCRALICPDGGMCDEGNTCCQNPWGGYGCCPLPNAECCSDHLHCCYEGTLCDMQHGKCVNKTHTLEWVRRVITKQTSLPQAIECPDGESECPDGTTCCQMPDGSWGCCPMPNAVCCEDKMHCCPEGTTCDISHSRCVTSVQGSIPLLRKFPAVQKGKRDKVSKCPSKPANQKCDESFSCPQDATCCKLASGSWGCCPLPKAVCCEDHLHCCPHNTVCNVAAGTCDGVPDAGVRLTIPWLSKIPAVVVGPEKERCDETSTCPTGTTCCKEKSGTWACCLLPQAVCCADHEHCCPQGYKCDVAQQSCEHTFLPSMPWVKKQPALSVTHISISEPSTNMESSLHHRIKCDAQTSCPRGSTCCYMEKLKKWGCCPLPKAVCCLDGYYCCPSGYICDKEKPTCRKGKHQIPWFKKQPAMSIHVSEVRHDFEDVKCDNTTSCAAGTTCCRLRTGKWGCCPLVMAVCCEDHEHCCPQSYTCDLETGTCIKSSTTHTIALSLIRALSEDEDDVMCDATKRCSKNQTCCRVSDEDWACCPFVQAVCCKDMKHCCPKGYTCDPKKRCTKASPLTWWD
ncbi:granulins isoform X1, partial [Silurus asotus]